MAKMSCVLLACVVAIIISCVAAISEEQYKIIKAQQAPVLEKCSKENGITMEEILAAKEKQDVDALKPCFYACFFRNIDLIDDQGFYAVEAAKESHKKFIKDEKIRKEADAITDACAKVNDQKVNDGTKGCERARLLAICLMEYKAEITPLLQ